MRDGDWLIGWGCASAVYPTHVGAAAARVRLTADGKARVQIAAHDLGTGAYTVIGQIAQKSSAFLFPPFPESLVTAIFLQPPLLAGVNTTPPPCLPGMKACQAYQSN